MSSKHKVTTMYEEKETDQRESVIVTIPDIPISVHRKMIQWNRKLNAARQKDFTLMAAYREYLIEKTEKMKL